MAVGSKVGTKKASATVRDPSKVSVMRPDQFSGGGLADDFDGTISEVRFVPWNYPTESKPEGSIDHYVLAARVTIEREDGEPVVQHYSAGDLQHFVPSMDGDEGVDLDGDDLSQMEGVYALKVGKKDALSATSNWAHFLTALNEAGWVYEEMDPDVRFLEGLEAHFNRVPQRKRSGVGGGATGADGQQRQREILVVTEIKARPGDTKKGAAKAAAKPAATSAKAATAKAAPAAEANGANDIDEPLREALLTALRASDGSLGKSKLAGVAIKAFDGAQKTVAVKRATTPEFLESLAEYGMFWDGDEATLTLVE
jgi:hypothetical protein